MPDLRREVAQPSGISSLDNKLSAPKSSHHTHMIGAELCNCCSSVGVNAGMFKEIFVVVVAKNALVKFRTEKE